MKQRGKYNKTKDRLNKFMSEIIKCDECGKTLDECKCPKTNNKK